MPLKYCAVKMQLKSQNTAISVLKLALAQSFLFLSSVYAFVAQPRSSPQSVKSGNVLIERESESTGNKNPQLYTLWGVFTL